MLASGVILSCPPDLAFQPCSLSLQVWVAGCKVSSGKQHTAGWAVGSLAGRGCYLKHR